MTPSEAPKALQASECSELLDPTRANCWISAQHQPGKFTPSGASGTGKPENQHRFLSTGLPEAVAATTSMMTIIASVMIVIAIFIKVIIILLIMLIIRGHWAEAHIKIARMTLTIKLDRNWSSFQLANRAPPLSVTDSSIAPSARMSRLARDEGPETLRNDLASFHVRLPSRHAQP